MSRCSVQEYLIRGEWTVVLGLTEGSLSGIHHLSCREKLVQHLLDEIEAKQPIMRRALWGYLLPLLDRFRKARKRSQETVRFPRGGVEGIQGYRAGLVKESDVFMS